MNKLFTTVLLLNFLFVKVAAQSTVSVSERRSIFEKGDITGNISYQFGRVTDVNKNNDGTLNFAEPVYRLRSSMVVSTGVRLFELVYLRTTFYYHLNKNINAPWINTDYAYALERTNFDNNSFSYGYVNNDINKYSNSGRDFMESLSRGSFYVRYYNLFPSKLIGRDSTLNLNYFITARYAFRYLNAESETVGDVLQGKPVLSLGLRYTFFKYFYLEGSVHGYPVRSTKLSWDPDYTYGFGFNKYSHLTIGFSYGNYTTNRFPWKKKEIEGYGFLDGMFSILINFRW